MKIKSDLIPDADINMAGIDTYSSGKTTGDSVVHVVQREFSSFIEDIESLAQQAMSLSGDDLDRLREKLQQRVQRARTLAKEMGEAAGESVLQHARNTAVGTSRYVHDRPWYSLGMGAVVIATLVLLHRGWGRKHPAAKLCP